MNTFGQLRTLATAITIVAETHDVGHSFPNLTIPHFDLRAEEIAELTGAEMILFVPFVEESERPGFESYAVQNQYWIEEGYVSFCTRKFPQRRSASEQVAYPHII